MTATPTSDPETCTSPALRQLERLLRLRDHLEAQARREGGELAEGLLEALGPAVEAAAARAESGRG